MTNPAESRRAGKVEVLGAATEKRFRRLSKAPLAGAYALVIAEGRTRRNPTVALVPRQLDKLISAEIERLDRFMRSGIA